EEVDVFRIESGLLECRARGGKSNVRQRFFGRGDPALADTRARHDPLVGRVDDARQLVVRQHALGNVTAETRDRDPRALRLADHDRSTAKVSAALHATLPSTRASALPRPTGPRTLSSSQRSSSVSPGSTIR